MKKIFLMSILGLIILNGSNTLVNADEQEAINPYEVEQINEIYPRISWSGSAYISRAWTNITASNNLFNDSPKVTNNASNVGTLSIRVINGKGAQVGSVKTVGPGQTVTLDKIPAISGTYTIQGYSGTPGTYTLSIT